MRFQKGHPEELFFPLTSIPTIDSNIVSPMIGKAHGVPTPSMPGDEGFQELVYEVFSVRDDVQSRVWPSWFLEKYGVDPEIPEPLKNQGIVKTRPEKAANIVHMDLPLELGEILLRWAVGEGIPLKKKPLHTGLPFVATIPGYLDELGSNVYESLYKAFEVKYYYGRPRPEEVSGLGPKMTYYPEGCPAHPEYVAGHGSAAGATNKTVNQYFDLSDAQKKVVETTTLHFCMYRTFAGVHYADANLEGWNLGNT